MKRSELLLLIVLALSFLPASMIKISLWYKCKKQDWTFYSSRTKMDSQKIKFLDLSGVKAFRYQYHSDSSFLEYNNHFEGEYLKLIEADTLRISPDKTKSTLNQMSHSTGFNAYSVYDPFSMYTADENDMFNGGTEDLIFHGPICPSILAKNSSFYIDSVGDQTSFEFDLDFSNFYWENFKKLASGKIDRRQTSPWYLNELKLKLKGSSYYSTENIYFKKAEIKASHKTNINFDTAHFENTQFEADSTVTVSAPIALWNKIKYNIK